MLSLFVRPIAILAFAASMISPVSHQYRVQHRATIGPTGRYAVILVLDGARPNYFHLVPMPNLERLVRRGVTYSHAIVGQEIAITPTSHATIGTGDFPRTHGVQGFMWEDPRTHTMTRPTDPAPMQQGALEAVMARHHVSSIAASVKSAYPGSKIVSVSGHKCYASDAMGTASADYILCSLIYHDRWVAQAVGTHRPPPGAINNPHFDVPIPPPNSGFAPAVEQWKLGTENDWAIRYALWAVRRVHYPRVLMVNLPETDVIGHFNDGRHDAMPTLMRHFDRELGQVIHTYQQAGILNRTDFIITADHGMTPIRTRLPFSILDQAMQDAGAGKVFLEADTAAAMGIARLDRAQAVARNVARFGASNIDATYYKTMVRGQWRYRPAFVQPGLPSELRRAYLYLMNTAAAADGPDVLAVYAPHVTTGDRIARGYHWLAGHLGPQWDEQHIPLIMAGPGIRSGVRSSYPARLVDIAPTVERLLGARSGPVDGIVLGDALRKPTALDTAIQARLGRTLRPFIRAIHARSGND